MQHTTWPLLDFFISRLACLKCWADMAWCTRTSRSIPNHTSFLGSLHNVVYPQFWHSPRGKSTHPLYSYWTNHCNIYVCFRHFQENKGSCLSYWESKLSFAASMNLLYIQLRNVLVCQRCAFSLFSWQKRYALARVHYETALRLEPANQIVQENLHKLSRLERKSAWTDLVSWILGAHCGSDIDV